MIGELDNSDAALDYHAMPLSSSNDHSRDISTPRDEAYRILIQASRAHNLVARDEFESAIEGLRRLRAVSIRTSMLQQIVARRVDSSLGQALRYQG